MLSWTTVTALGDAILTLPTAALLTIWLLAGRAWKMALWWCALFGAGLVLVVVTKLAFIGWGIGIRSMDFTGVSGHAMRATAVFPALVYVLLSRARAVIRLPAIGAGFVCGLLVGISRVMVGAHSIPEVVAGCALGGLVSLSFIWITDAMPRPRLNRPLIVLSVLGLCGTSFAEPAPTKLWLKEVALYLSGRDEAFRRGGSNEGASGAVECDAHGRSTNAGGARSC